MSGFATSWLFVPGNRPERFTKALSSGAGAIIIDLEDAVAPASKDDARREVARFLTGRSRPGDVAVAVRINPLGTLNGAIDVSVLSGLAPDYLVVPKAEVPQELDMLGRILADAASQTQIIALVESATGVAAAPQLARADTPMAALMFGAADYASDLGRSVATYRADFARASIVNAAAAGSIAALDSPWFDVDDEAGLLAEATASFQLGFHAKAAIHPRQVGVIKHTFAVSDEERELATRYIAASVDGAALVDGKMVDVAMLRWARRIVG